MSTNRDERRESRRERRERLGKRLRTAQEWRHVKTRFRSRVQKSVRVCTLMAQQVRNEHPTWHPEMIRQATYSKLEAKRDEVVYGSVITSYLLALAAKWILDKVIEFLFKHFAETVPVEDVAEVYAVAETHVASHFDNSPTEEAFFDEYEAAMAPLEAGTPPIAGMNWKDLISGIAKMLDGLGDVCDAFDDEG